MNSPAEIGVSEWSPIFEPFIRAPAGKKGGEKWVKSSNFYLIQ
jgi:hypothetical protein